MNCLLPVIGESSIYEASLPLPPEATCARMQVSNASVTKLCPTLYDLMDCSTPGFPVLLLECAQTHDHWFSDAIQPSLCHPLLLLPSIFPSIRVFCSESALCIRLRCRDLTRLCLQAHPLHAFHWKLVISRTTLSPSWQDLSESQLCQWISQKHPGFWVGNIDGAGCYVCTQGVCIHWVRSVAWFLSLSLFTSTL